MATLDKVTLGKSLSSLSFDLPICQMEMMPQQRTKCSPSVMSAAAPGRASSLARLLTSMGPLLPHLGICSHQILYSSPKVSTLNCKTESLQIKKRVTRDSSQARSLLLPVCVTFIGLGERLSTRH